MASSNTWNHSTLAENITVDTLYELRDVMSRIKASVEINESSADSISWANTQGTATLFQRTDSNHLGWSNSFTLHGHYSNHQDGDWNNPESIDLSGDSFPALYRTLANYPTSDSSDYFLAFDLNSINNLSTLNGNSTNYNQYVAELIPPFEDAEPWQVSAIERFERSDVVVELTDNFWENIQSIKDRSAPGFSQNPVVTLEDTRFTDGSKLINLNDLEASNYKEFAALFTEELDFSLKSDSSLYGAEFAWIHGIAYFISDTGNEIKLNLTDNDSPWSSISGLSGVDVETDKNGHHLSTEIEFGLYDHNVASVLAAINDHQWQTSSGLTSSIPSNNQDEVRWELDRIDVSVNDGVPPFDHGISISTVINDLVDNSTPISFTTKGVISLPTPEVPALKLEVNDFVSSSYNFAESSIDFDLQLNGPTRDDPLTLPISSGYSATLTWSPVSADFIAGPP